MIYLGVTLLVLALLSGWVLTVFCLPGNWLMVGAAAIYAWFVPADSRWDLGWGTVAALLILALIGEALEFAASAMGASRVGGSKRGAVLAIIGSMFGALLGGLISPVAGSVIPVVGAIIAVILLASLGALGGAMLGETWKGRDLGESWKIGQGAFWGRMLGTVAKTAIASVMVAVGILALASSVFYDDKAVEPQAAMSCHTLLVEQT